MVFGSQASDTGCQYRPCWETFQNWNSEVQRDVSDRSSLVHAPSLKGNSATAHVFTPELNYLLCRRLLHLLSVKLLNTENGKHSIIVCRVFVRFCKVFLFQNVPTLFLRNCGSTRVKK